jgi:2-iminobutanoate/2-iminopropanoate deaminase
VTEKPTAVRIERAWHSGAPYSPAIRTGDLLYLSGLVPVDPADGSTVGSTIQAQTEQVISVMRRLLAAGGAELSDVVKTTVFLTDPSLAAGMNEVYSTHFAEPRPARSTVVVGPLARPEFMIEVESIARVPSR